jgi:enoyl-CoA hydratase/3-hydroxyacyl-CoA dehydrogenase
MSQHKRTEIIYRHIHPNENVIPSHVQLTFAPTSGNEDSSGSKELVKYSVQNNVAVLTFNSPPVNALSDEFVAALKQNIERAYGDDKVKAVVLSSGVPKFFIAGADITSFVKRQNSTDPNTASKDLISNDFAARIESGPKPTVAAIDGVALGGGLEIAMACNGRVATAASSFGLPELTLGIIPGLGGTQRLPRLIGVKKALEMILTSRPIGAKDALSLKLVESVVSSEQLIQTAVQLALEMANGTKARTRALQLRTRLEPPQVLEQIFAQYEKTLDPRQPQQRAAFNSVRAGLEFDGNYGLLTEAREFKNLITSNVAKALCHFFFSERATVKIPGLQPTKDVIKSVGIVGGGTMGSGIAIACLLAGIRVVLKEVDQKFLDIGLGKIKGIFDSRLQRKRMTQDQYNKATSLLSGQIDYSGFDKLDMVIEAVLEQLPLKQQVFVELEQHCNKSCILATNTSTINIDEIGAKTKAADRIIGLHFFSPAYVMPLLEIIRTKNTSSETLSKSLKFSSQIKKTPVVVLNEIGFAVNRIFLPYFMASAFLVDRGVDPYRIDKALQKFGFAVGPFRVADISGIDVGKFSKESQSKLFKERIYNSYLDKLLLEDKRLGEKTGAGYYLYQGEGEVKKPVEDKELAQKYLNKARDLAKATPLKKKDLTDEDIQHILLLPAVNEACRVIEEKLVYRVSDIDVASTFGMNFPRFYGGIVKWADTFLGAKKVLEELEELYKETGIKLFEPSKYLRECAESGRSLEAGL